MKTKLILAAALVLTSSITNSSPHEESYLGIQYSMGNYKETGFSAVNPTFIMLRGGKHINENFSIEGRYGFGAVSDSLNVQGYDFDLDVDSLFGLYAIGRLPVPNSFSTVYAIVGHTSGKITASGLGISVSESDSGLSFGVGVDLFMSKTADFNIEYINYLSDGNYDFTALSVGVTKKF